MEVKRYCVGAFGTNCYLVKKENDVLIIDPGASYSKILAHLDETWNIQAILLTHGHFDHIQAVDKLQAHFHCPVYLNEKDEELARNEKINSLGNYSASLHGKTEALDEGTLTIGNFIIQVTEAPGHTSGSVLLKIEDYLFTGDVLFKGSIGRTDLYSGNASEMKRSLQLFYTMDENLIVCPGHDETTVLKNELLYNPYLG